MAVIIEGIIAMLKRMGGHKISMENVNLNMVYKEIKLVKAKLEYLENILVPEEEMTEEELAEIDKLRVEALEEHRKGQTIPVEKL